MRCRNRNKVEKRKKKNNWETCQRTGEQRFKKHKRSDVKREQVEKEMRQTRWQKIKGEG